MSINDFAEEDIEFLKANYQNMTIEEIASAVEKTYRDWETDRKSVV